MTLTIMDFIPGVGTFRAIRKTYQSPKGEMTIEEQVNTGFLIAGTGFATTVALGSYTQGQVYMARFGIAAAPYIPYVVAASVIGLNLNPGATTSTRVHYGDVRSYRAVPKLFI